MFKILIKPDIERNFAFGQVCCCDTLIQAEQYALGMLRKQFADSNVLMVHREDLVYDVYDIGDPVAELQIKLAD